MTHTEAVSTLASERYLLDEMTEPEREDFESHFFDCEVCADDVTAAARMRDGASAGFVAGPQIARIATFAPAQKRTEASVSAPAMTRQPWYRSTAVPWAVAATLAVVVGYQSQAPSRLSPSGQGGGTPAGMQALTPVLIRPASRGAVPSVSVAASHVALALDVDAGRATEVSYELRDAGAAIVASGRTAAPVAGAPLLLVIPTFTLKPEAQYILSVRDVASPDRALGEYRFAVTP